MSVLGRVREAVRRVFARRRLPDALGPRGEELAAIYVRKTLGYRVLARNVRCPHGELDIVALDGETLVIIEVRTRATEVFGSPESSIRFKKRQALQRSIKWFIASRKLQVLQARLDVIAVVCPKEGEPTIRHHRHVM